MAKGLIDRLLDGIFDANWMGKRGEKLTEKELKWVNLLGRKGKILKNVYVPKSNGETTEIDVIYITQKGIFVIESKNYSGWIFGDEKSMYWTASLSKNQKNRFYNPIKQNITHIKWLQSYLQKEIPLYSLIVFSERCQLKKISLESDEIKVIKRDRLYATIRSIWNTVEDCVTDDEIERIYESLKGLTKVDKKTKQLHIDRIQGKYLDKKSNGEKLEKEAMQIISSCELENEISEKQISIVSENDNKKQEELMKAELRLAESEIDSEKICSKCGKTMILRVAKKGKNAGNKFWGCSAFPKCRNICEYEDKSMH